jgi:hypothetical protein
MAAMKLDKKRVLEQAAFCKDLATRLELLVKENIDKESWGGMQNHCQVQQDCIRLRREVLALSNLVKTEW